MIDPGLKGKVAVITGGNNPYGIGAAVARELAEQGAAAFIHYFRPASGQPGTPASEETFESDETPAHKGDHSPTPGLELYYRMQTKSADEVVRSIRDKGGRAESWEADLSDPAAVPELFDRAEKAFGPVSVLVNNAADYEADTFLPETMFAGEDRALWEDGPQRSTITAATHGRHFGVNTRAVALSMAEFTRRHVANKQTWGRIVNISADCSEGSPGEISYRASKYALESYSRSAAAELGPLGITVNVVSPGPIQTGYISHDIEQKLIESIPLRRVGRPEDVAAAVVFLASDQAGWVTGQLITVHGGHRMAPGL